MFTGLKQISEILLTTEYVISEVKSTEPAMLAGDEYQ